MSYLSPPQMLNAKPKKDIGFILLSIVCVILAFFLLLDLWIARNCILILVDGSSMEETLHDDDLLYAIKGNHADYGDIIIINVEEYRQEDNIQGERIIKRLIGKAGDVVRCQDGVVSVKYYGTDEFTPLNEPYTKGQTKDFGEVTVKEGEIFFLGDHRTVSADSRIVGCYLVSDIDGVVPQWAVENKDFIKKWENFRTGFRNLIKLNISGN